MHDVFYRDHPTGLFAFERPASSLEHAAQLSRTEFFWYVEGVNDYTGVDFLFRPPPWEAEHTYVWPDQWNQYGGLYLSSKNHASKLIYHFVDQIVPSLPCQDHWHEIQDVDYDKFDWSWRPHPKDPPYIYVWGNRWNPVELEPVLEYRVPGATQTKYMSNPVEVLPQMQRWHLLHDIEPGRFDLTWRPDPREPAFIYVWGNQHWSAEKMPTLEYHAPGATERKYMTHTVSLAKTQTNWRVLANIAEFDNSWCPDPGDPPYRYVFGNQHYPATIMPTVIYTVPGATQDKFMDYPVAKLAPCRDNWEIPSAIDESLWDWSWLPNPKDPAYVYEFATQWQRNGGPIYRVPGATEIKYMDVKAVRLAQPELSNWNNLHQVDGFDYSWHPDNTEDPYIYVFGNQHWPGTVMPTVTYTVMGATESKFIDDVTASLSPNRDNWQVLDEIAEDRWDWTWVPNPLDPKYDYVFGNQWYSAQQKPSIVYKTPGASQTKFMDEPRTRRAAAPELFIQHYACDFDYTWEPDPGSPPYNYVFGNQHYPAEIMPTVEYRMAGATETKYMDHPRAELPVTKQNWVNTTDLPFEFDQSWCPDPGDPALIYVFGNQHYPAQVMNTIEYRVPGATTRKYMEQAAQLMPVMERWDVPENIDVNTIDFSWCPHPEDLPYVHHFGSNYQISTGLTYTVPGAQSPKFHDHIPTKGHEKPVIEVPDIFFIDKMNASSAGRFSRLQEKYPTAQKVRYANSIMETVKRCLARTQLKRFWVVTSDNVYDEFDFAWHPQPWQGYMTHVFGSQWQKWSETFLINRHEFERNAKWAKSLAEFPNLNFVQDQKVVLPDDLFEIWYVDMMNPESAEQLERLRARYSKINTVRFVDNYLDTFKRIVDRASTEYIWIVNSNCNYTKWDFSWRPEVWQEQMLHVFATADQEFGDTFFARTDLFKEQLSKITDLAFYETINYTREQLVQRYDTEVVVYDSDTLVDAVRTHRFQHAYAYFKPRGSDSNVAYTPSLWKGSERSIHLLSKSGSHALIPRDAQLKLETQLYDYPYILKHRTRFVSDHPLDIIYLSNGEPDADHWYEVLLERTKNAPNRVKRVQNINGRAAAYQACASVSETAWFFNVFAKLEVVEDFDWSWQPDRLQEPKHYIFNAKNPVNGLEYGHMGMIAYNSKLTLATNKWGLDFTLSKAHEVVPELSGVAHYNQDAWTAWRTAFREVIKLRDENSEISRYRMSQWMTGTGAFAEYSIKGARDAVEYYESVNGAMDKLLLTFEWDWLRDYYHLKV